MTTDTGAEEFGPLPLSDRQEQLEELSFRAFQQILPIDKFRFRDERGGKDKGVDASIELLEGRRNTNFRAQLQLKGTDSIDVNSDGSIAHSVRVSNLNYLLNVSSALYVLYVAPRHEIRYVWARDEQRRLDTTNAAWERQKTVTLHFKDILTPVNFDLIYERIFREAQLSRNIHRGITSLPQMLSDLGISSPEQPKVKQQLSITKWIAITEQNPNDAKAWMHLAESYYEEGELSKAFGAINRAWDIGPHDNDMRAIRACVLAEYGGSYGGPRLLITKR